MGAISIRPTRGRSALLGGLVAAGLILAPMSAFAQQPGAAQPTPGQPSTSQPTPGQPSAPSTPSQPAQQPAQPAQPGLTFEGDAGLLLMQVKPDKTSDFEAVMGKLHEALTKTDKPERKQQASGWKIYKSTDPGPQGNVLYVAIIDPPLKGADYTVAKILFEVFPTEVQAIFPIYRDAFAAGLNKVNLQLVQHFGQPAKPAPPLPAAATTGAVPGGTTPGGTSGATGTSGTTTTPPSTPQEPSPTPR
jgi:hypothetical protein